MGEREGTSAAAVAEMVRERRFILTDAELSEIESRGGVLTGWGFAYRAARAESGEQRRLLSEGLRSADPHVREHACDLIGDWRVLELRAELAALFDDPFPAVAQSARYNYEMLAA